MVAYHFEAYYTLLMTINLTLTLIVMFAACLCCKRKVQKNELLGLEGMVKLKNPDEVIVITTVGNSESQAELNASTVSNADSEKRSSTAAHRSLPDIPIAEQNGDNGSELYETVADKQLLDAQHQRDKSPTPSLKKQTSVSQHSSISQADDVSSPYSRVKNLPHDYAKVQRTEHPYAQLNAPSTSAAAAATSNASIANHTNHSVLHGADNMHRSSQLSNGSTQNLSDVAPQAEIPAASAIAGMISASQDLPYMTPPIGNQHFSGDSQDSSKGYTSISVREPLANILAQQPTKATARAATLSRDTNDSHYATVSDDSDETYAAIEDPNNRNLPNAADIYTSGSETYAQIQPMQGNPIVVAVEINNSASSAAVSSILGSSTNTLAIHLNQSGVSNTSQHRPTSTGSSHIEHVGPVPPPVDSLRAQMHSRQASSSSNNSSSICNLGSPKPEKRQANSPLPPTPKSSNSQASHHLHASSNSNLTSGRNSVISVIETGIGANMEPLEFDSTETSPKKQSKSLSPSKDIEGMYAKVMKKHKLSRNSPSSQNSSPILTRKQTDTSLGISPLDTAAALLMDTQKITISGDKNRVRSNSYSAKDHGYETIPADALRNTNVNSTSGTVIVGIENRKSDCYANMLQKERLQQAAVVATALNHTNAKPPKHYETIANAKKTSTTAKRPPTHSNSSNDPGYEQLLTPKVAVADADRDAAKNCTDYDPNYEVLKSAAHSDDGYAKVLEKKRPQNDSEDTIDGYSKVKSVGGDDGTDGSGGYSTIPNADANHNYASILETKAGHNSGAGDETESDHYARIAEATVEATQPTLPPPPPPELPLSIASTSATNVNSMLLTSPSSTTLDSMLHNSSSITTITTTSSNSTLSTRQTPTSSQYESLTGSETDPNYESVCYKSVSGTENPYERLQSEMTDTTLSSPMTPDDGGISDTMTTATTATTLQLVSNSKEVNTCEVVVDDYFQV